MTNDQQSPASTSDTDDAASRAAATTAMARIRRSMRPIRNAHIRRAGIESVDAIEREGAVYGPLTKSQAVYNDDLAAEIARQDANPTAYDKSYTPEQLAAAFDVPVEICRGLGTEA